MREASEKEKKEKKKLKLRHQLKHSANYVMPQLAQSSTSQPNTKVQ
jgi:hypothetical protein